MVLHRLPLPVMDLSTIVEVNEQASGPRTVEELSRIPEALQLILAPFQQSLPDTRLYGEDKHGLLRYFEEVVGPYAQLIDKGFPTSALELHQIRADSIQFLKPHVGELLRFLVRAVALAVS